MEIIDIARRLIGPIQPVGETHADARRLVSLTDTAHLVDLLLCDLEDAALNANRDEASMRAIGQRAKQMLEYLKGSERNSGDDEE
jgi:hypothetical protein